MARLGITGYFIVLVACENQAANGVEEHFSLQLFADWAQLSPQHSPRDGRPGFINERINGEVVRLQSQSQGQVRLPIPQGFSGEGKDQVEADAWDFVLEELVSAPDVVSSMAAPEHFKGSRVERLRPETGTRHSGLAQKTRFF